MVLMLVDLYLIYNFLQEVLHFCSLVEFGLEFQNSIKKLLQVHFVGDNHADKYRNFYQLLVVVASLLKQIRLL